MSKSVSKPVTDQIDPTDAYVGSRLKERRLALRMSQTDLGASAGISFQQIQKYERGVNRVAISMLKKFAEALRVPVTFFLPDGTNGTAMASSSRAGGYQVGPTKDAQELLALFDTIDDPKLRKQVLELTKTLSKAANKNGKK